MYLQAKNQVVMKLKSIISFQALLLAGFLATVDTCSSPQYVNRILTTLGGGFMLELKKKKLVISVFSLMLSAAILVGCGGSSNKASSTAENGTLLKSIEVGMGTNSSAVTNAQYDKYFKEGSAATGVPAIIAAGKFSINGYAIPATASECTSKYPNGYLVNQVAWLYFSSTDAAWRGGYVGSMPPMVNPNGQQAVAASYDAAALRTALGLMPGNEIRLYDTDGDGFADSIQADYKEGVWVGSIIANNDKTYGVFRGDIDVTNKTSSEGTIFDGSHFTATSGEKIKAADFDPLIAPGDVALYWYGPNGWAMQRAQEINGIFVTGADHKSYEMNSATYGDVAYKDAIGLSRDNLSINMRPGEFTNAQNYFGFSNNGEGLKTSLWLVPSTDASIAGAPIGFTTNSNARIFLAEAIAIATVDLKSVTVSADGTDVLTTGKWVTQAQSNQLANAIARAKAAMESPTSSNLLLDYQTYLLYLTLNGSSHDQGARGGGFAFTGFMNAIQYGTK